MRKEKKLMALLLERSEQAIPNLHRQYGSLCRAMAKNILGSGEDADEVVSETFLAVWNQIPPDKPKSLTAYITRILRNKAIDRRDYNTGALRDIRLNVCMSELEEILPGGVEPEKVVESRVITDTINRYLASLDKTNRQIFVRRYFGMLSNKEIAKDFGMTEQAIRSRLFRMRESLREELEKEGIYV